jgi:hypothetical protein
MCTLFEEEDIIQAKIKIYQGKYSEILDMIPYNANIKQLIRIMLGSSKMRPDFEELESTFKNLFVKTGMLPLKESTNLSDEEEDEFLNVQVNNL